MLQQAKLAGATWRLVKRDWTTDKTARDLGMQTSKTECVVESNCLHP